MLVVPIATTHIDWHNYVKIVAQSLGRSPTRSLDSANLPVGGAESFLVSLGEFTKENIDPYDFLDNSQNCFSHYYITFFAEITNKEYTKLIPVFNGLVLSISNSNFENVKMIITGSIYSWRSTILQYMTQHDNIVIREFLNEIYNHLIREFKIMFSGYRLKESFILEKIP